MFDFKSVSDKTPLAIPTIAFVLVHDSKGEGNSTNTELWKTGKFLKRDDNRLGEHFEIKTLKGQNTFLKNMML